MGNTVSCSIGDSIVSPGKTSILSDPIEADYDVFLNELLALVKYPISAREESVVKEVKVTELSGPDEFEVVAILDGAKLSKWGYGNPENPSLDRISSHVKFTVDRKGRRVLSDNYEPYWQGEEQKLAIKTFCDFTKDPLRLDYYWEMPDGTRVADKGVRDALSVTVAQAASAVLSRKAFVKLDEGKKVFTTGPIDESVAKYDPFFDAVIAVLKQSGGTLEEVSDTKFKLLPPTPEVTITTTYSFDKDAGTITAETTSSDGKKVSSTNYTITKSPLSFEGCTEMEDSGRMLGPGAQRFTQGLVDAAIGQASSSGWSFGGLFG